jgi:hypothetical protein
MKLQLEEYEWSKNENNPTVKAQILANKLTEIDLQYYDEEKQAELATLQAELQQALTIAQYAPQQAEAELNRIYAETNRIITETEAAKAEENKPTSMTAKQMNTYNTYYGNLSSAFADDPNGALEHVANNEQAYRQALGDIGYEKLIEQLDADANAEPAQEETTYTLPEIKKELDGIWGLMSGSGTQVALPRDEVVTQILQKLDAYADQLTETQYNDLLAHFGITAKEISNYDLAQEGR